MARSNTANRSSSFNSTNGNVNGNGNDDFISLNGGEGDDFEDCYIESDSSSLAPPMPASLSTAIPAELAGAVPLMDRFQIETFLRLMHKQIQSSRKRRFFSKKSAGPQVRDKFTFEDMCFQKESIPTSLLKINADLVSKATKLFQIILKYKGVDHQPDRLSPTSLDERIELVGKLYKQTLKGIELRDELFVQISKQTRNNPDRQYLVKAWELMYLCASSMPPSKDIGPYLSENVHNVAHGLNTDSEVRDIALSTLNALKLSVNAGPRQTIPGREEIEALLTG